MLRFVVPLLLLFAAQVFAEDTPPVFKSDVAMTRVDAQVVDREGRAITGLQLEDFTLKLDGHAVPIRNIASENMPIDILLLLDVSGSMEPHVERIASAAQEALNVLAAKDRVAIMVFDTSTRVRLPFRNSHSEVTGELKHLLRAESFDGGTRITHALLDAASYVQRQARPEARRAIVVLTDDETQDAEDEARVEAGLGRANAVLSFLQAPYEPPTLNGGGAPQGRGGGSWPGGGTWPGGGGGIGFPGGTWPGGGGVGLPGGGPGGIGTTDPSHSAGTADIARGSGGDTMRVDQASALEDTLARLRQRYALYFYLPEGSKLTGRGVVQVGLSQFASIRFDQAEIRYRRVYLAGSAAEERTGTTVVTRTQAPVDKTEGPTMYEEVSGPKGRRVAVNEDSGPQVNTVDSDAGASDGEAAPASPAGKRANQASAGTAQPGTPASPAAKGAPPSGGRPRANPQNALPE